MNTNVVLSSDLIDSTFGLPVHNEELWQKFLSYNLSHVTDMFKSQIPKHAKIASDLELECRRFLCVTTLVKGQQLVPSEVIDKYWHNFILFTVDYRDFCLNTAGKFIHHYPLATDTNQVFKGTQVIINSLFGNFKNSDLWSSHDAARSKGKSCCGSGVH